MRADDRVVVDARAARAELALERDELEYESGLARRRERRQERVADPMRPMASRIRLRVGTYIFLGRILIRSRLSGLSF